MDGDRARAKGRRAEIGARTDEKTAVPTLERNNTAFPAKSTEMLRKLYREYSDLRAGPKTSDRALWASVLKYYQFLCREVLSNPTFGYGTPGNSRGLLLYKQMGMGKTIEAIGIAIAVIDRYQPVVILPHSLEENFDRSIDKVCVLVYGEEEGKSRAATAKHRFRYISMDAYNAADQVARKVNTLEGKFVIVDEAHNFFRAIINSGNVPTNARRLYEMIMEARDIRIAFLTGTPCSKDPFELVPCFNMLAGFDLLPVQYEIFYELYVDKENNMVKNRDKLANRLVGMVSHAAHNLPTAPSDGAEKEKPRPRADGGFPERLPTVIARVEMSKEQYRQYLLAREKEETEGRGGDAPARERATPPLALPGSEKKVARSYYVKSRSVSNFAPPRDISEFVPVEKLPDSAFTAESSPKISLLVRTIVENPVLSLVYSQFVDVGGLAIVARFLKLAGFTEFKPAKEKKLAAEKPAPAPAESSTEENKVVDVGVSEDIADEIVERLASSAKKPKSGAAAPRQFAIISGEVSIEARKVIQTLANDPRNSHGEILSVLLVSKTGAEGLDLLCFRRTYELEPYWDKAREEQVIYRAVRLGSHDRLHVDERDVTPFLFIATANKEMLANIPEDEREEKTIDELFHERATARFKLNESFRAVLSSVCLECSLFGYGNCRLCVPTEARLFIDDPAQDLKLADPCMAAPPKTVKAKPITVDGVTYYYVVDPRDPLGFKFFEIREDIGGYAPMDPANPIVNKLLGVVDGNDSLPEFEK